MGVVIVIVALLALIVFESHFGAPQS